MSANREDFSNVIGGSSTSARRRPRMARAARSAPYPDVDSLPVSKRMHEHQERMEHAVKTVKTGLERFFSRKKGGR